MLYFAPLSDNKSFWTTTLAYLYETLETEKKRFYNWPSVHDPVASKEKQVELESKLSRGQLEKSLSWCHGFGPKTIWPTDVWRTHNQSTFWPNDQVLAELSKIVSVKCLSDKCLSGKRRGILRLLRKAELLLLGSWKLCACDLWPVLW